MLTPALVPAGTHWQVDQARAMAQLPAIVQAFRRELGLGYRSHYLHLLESELPVVAHGLEQLGLVHGGCQVGLAMLSTDIVEGMNATLKATFLRCDHKKWKKRNEI